MEIINLVILGLGVIEGLVLCIEMHRRNELLRANNLLIDTMQKVKELEDRRKATGTFSDPLGDMYRKNTKGLYRPVKPYRGDEEDV